MAKPRLLDLFCGAGGAAMGYHRAGFDVVGVDIKPQKRFPLEFVMADAMTYPLDGFDVIHASPPCQRWSLGSARWDRTWPDLLTPTQTRLAGRMFVIENVPRAPLRVSVLLCGTMFGLNVVRHRIFQSPVSLTSPPHPPHPQHKKRVMRPARDGSDRMVSRSAYEIVAGHGGDGFSSRLLDWRKAMGIDWMTRGELSEAIPPAYTEFIGKQLIEMLRKEDA